MGSFDRLGTSSWGKVEDREAGVLAAKGRMPRTTL